MKCPAAQSTGKASGTRAISSKARSPGSGTEFAGFENIVVLLTKPIGQTLAGATVHEKSYGFATSTTSKETLAITAWAYPPKVENKARNRLIDHADKWRFGIISRKDAKTRTQWG